MLRAILLQLSAQRKEGHEDLDRLQRSYQSSLPPSQVLIQYLEQSMRKFHRVYIILDALDESPKNGPRARVLDTLDTLRKMSGLHLLVTSRDESDILWFLQRPKKSKWILTESLRTLGAL